MGLLDKDPAKAAEKEEQRRRKDEDRQRQQREADERQRAAEFAASPRGRARAGYQAGRQFFQISLPLSATERTASGVLSGDPHAMKQTSVDPTDILAAVEAEGWRLENEGYVFRETGSVSRDKLMSSGQTAAVTGEIMGVYLLRRSGVVVPPVPGVAP
jgi:hypothetical protein